MSELRSKKGIWYAWTANATPEETCGRPTDTKDDPMYGRRRNPSFAWKRLEPKDQRTCNQLTQQLQCAKPFPDNEAPLARDGEDELVPMPVKENEILTDDTKLLIQGARADVTPKDVLPTQWPEELRSQNCYTEVI